MIIRNMFAENINRKINGVIKVDQSDNEIIEQEIREYVITKELKKHFISFFNAYSEAFDNPTDSMAVWISGFFGSGKSHFLKMLSYLLSNREVNGVKCVERFREKFEDDPATFMMIDRSTRGLTETILFNIDIEGPIKKDKTAVLRVFAKMFYNHLGFYGNDLKVAMLEKYIDDQGKTDEFRRVFEQKKGKSWVDLRKVASFQGKALIPTLVEVLDMSEADATTWFKDKSEVEYSIAQLSEDIKEYVSKKPDDFRLLFMVDEVGQYAGADTDLLLNLQSIVESLGKECKGKVWVLCTGQEAIDEIIKVQSDQFSRIQARFGTRLSLSSSSVDEVIQKRILKKTPTAETTLERVYNQNHAVLRNLFSFSNSVLDIKGYSGPVDFTVNYPFVPYQFILMQKIFAEVRKHGNAGKHFSGAERSMLSGFQEAAQAIQTNDEYALIPLFRFYDTVHTFLDGSIRRVIDRCQKAADNGDGIEQKDVAVLKLLYLIRYIDDVPANIDNIAILMSDNIRVDKISMREEMRNSLNRLLSQNYIGRTGDTYNFLTDEEQDIQREIRNTVVDTAAIVEKISQIIYGDIFTAKKFKYGKYDFPFDQMVDGIISGAATGGIRLRFLTLASDATDKDKFSLMTRSKGSEAICVLADTLYFEALENAMKIRKFVRQRNVIQLPKSIQDIIHAHQDEAKRYEEDAKAELKKAIETGVFFADGECLDIKNGDAKSKIEQALGYLVEHVYSELTLIQKHVDTDLEITQILQGTTHKQLDGDPNSRAAAVIEEYLEMQSIKNLPTSMVDIQTRFGNIPYGWKEIDIAAVVALLISEQKVTIKYAGNTIQPDNSRLVDMLRRKTEIGKTQISKRVAVSAVKMKKIKEFLREYFDIMDVPDDEDSLIRFIVGRFETQKKHYEDLLTRYDDHKYPDQSLLEESIRMVQDILNHAKDNIALIERILKKQEDLLDNHEDLARVESFFDTQVTLFDAAVKLEEDMRNDLSYMAQNAEGNQALNQLRLITTVDVRKPFDYKKIPRLNDLMKKIKEAHGALLKEKREELYGIVSSCWVAIHTAGTDPLKCKDILAKANAFFENKKKEIAEKESIALLDAMVPSLWQYKDDICEAIEGALKPPVKTPPQPPVKKHYKTIHRQAIFPTKTLESEEDIDAYVEKMRQSLKQFLFDCDGIKLN